MQRKITLVLLAIFLSMAVGSGLVNAGTYLGYNEWGGTWHDANKNWQGDGELCWAAAASNILDWAQWGTGTLNTETAIFNYFKQYWTNLDSQSEYAWHWWFDGSAVHVGETDWSQLMASGGGNFWSGLTFSNYYHGQSLGDTMATAYSDLKSGYGVTFEINTKTGGSHQFTVWGVDYTSMSYGNDYTGVWITDSDDNKTGLAYYGVHWDSANAVWELEGWYDGWYIIGVQALDRNPNPVPITPSPSTPLPPTLLLFGSGLLGLAGWRRFRKG